MIFWSDAVGAHPHTTSWVSAIGTPLQAADFLLFRDTGSADRKGKSDWSNLGRAEVWDAIGAEVYNAVGERNVEIAECSQKRVFGYSARKRLPIAREESNSS